MTKKRGKEIILLSSWAGIFLILFLIIGGCSAPQQTPTPSNEVTSTPTVTTLVTQLPTTTTITTAPIITTSAVQTTSQITSDDIKLHFMDIAFGAGNVFLDRWGNSYKAIEIPTAITYYRPYEAKESDKITLDNLIRDFNQSSKTYKLQVVDIQTHPVYLQIDFVTKNDFNNIDNKYSIVQKNDVIYAKLVDGTKITICRDLQGDQRNYAIVRSVLYQLGFRGETLKYPDSVFYSETDTNSKLSYIDKKAIEIMYGPGMVYGMTVDAVRKVIFIQ